MRLRALCCAALAAASCGTISEDPLATAATSLRDIRSGVLGFRLQAETDGGEESGFFVRGSFSLPEDDSLPVADLTYGRLGTPEEAETGLILTGDAAYAEVDGQAYELPPESVAGMVGAVDLEGGPLFDLELGKWVDDPEVSEGAALDGVPTTAIAGELDVVTALNDLLDLARDAGTLDIPPIEGDEAERLNEAVESARLEVVVDDDDAFRRLDVSVDLGAEARGALHDALEGLLGVGFELQVSIDRPNEPIEVAPPADPLPIEELTGGI
ncbi:MAG: hypothetical protein ABR613_09225 [Actinomycetota bacterium]